MQNRHTYWGAEKLYRWLARQPSCAGNMVVTCLVGPDNGCAAMTLDTPVLCAVQAAALESSDDISGALQGADLVFLLVSPV